MATLPQIVSRMCEGYSRNEIASETADFAELGFRSLRELRAELERLSKRT
jgi:hypothetical protein